MVWVATILSIWYYKSQALFIIACLHCKGKQLLPDTCLQQQKSQICSAPGELLLQKTKQTCDTNTIKFITSINDLSICYYHSLSLVDFRTFMTVKFCAKYSNLLDYILSVIQPLFPFKCKLKLTSNCENKSVNLELICFIHSS